MAIKADRQIDAVELSYYVNEVAERGVVVSVGTAGSGVALDNVVSVATVKASPSGAKPIGLLLQDFVNVDLTRYPINWHKDQANSGDKATIMTKGWAVTDKVIGTPAAQDVAVLTINGNVSGVGQGLAPYTAEAYPVVGRFRSSKDQAGFAKVYIDL